MTSTGTTESPAAIGSGPAPLPVWPVRTIAILTTLGDDGGHAIPVSAPVRAGDHRILLTLHRTRDSLQRIRERPQVAITILAAGNIAFTARGPAHIVQEPMRTAPNYVAIAIEVNRIDDHRQPGFEVQAGVDRCWVDDAERDALGQRVRSLTELAAR